MIKSKLPKLGLSIFSKMSNLALEHQAVNLSQGFPDFECSASLRDSVTYYMTKGFNQYAPMSGVPALLSSIANKLEDSYGRSFDAMNEITITAGATQAIFTTISAMIHPGDEVIVFDPAYDCYAPAINLCGGKVIPMQLCKPNYKVNWDDFAKLVNSKTKMVIVNTPHNPSGAIFSRDDWSSLVELTEKYNSIILSDEVYEHLVFDEHKHISCLEIEALNHRSLTVFSFGKTLHTTGWKIGYAVGTQKLTTELRKVHQYNVFSVNTPIQYAIADHIQDKSVYQDLGSFFQNKRDLLGKFIDKSSLVRLPCSGTYFQLVDYSNFSDKSDTDVAIELTKNLGVATIPISVFNHSGLDEKVLRICFAKKDSTIENAGELLCKI